MIKKGISIVLASFLLFSINTAPVDAAHHYKLSASVNKKRPKQYSTIILYTKGLPKKAKYKATFHYKSKKTNYKGKVGTPKKVRISRSTKGYWVKINIVSKYKGKTYRAQTKFAAR